VPRILTNNPNRRSMNWKQGRRLAYRTVKLQLPKLGIRRLIKRDPSKGTSQPYFDKLTDTKGVKGLSGASPVGTTLIKSNASTTGTGAGRRVVQDRGTNKSLKKR
jgi:hypothetical protein